MQHPPNNPTRDAELQIYLKACAHYEAVLEAAYGRPGGRSPDPAEACAIAKEWVAIVAGLRSHADASDYARELLRECDHLRENLITSLCDEIGDDWQLLDALDSVVGFKSQFPVQLEPKDQLRLGWLRLMLCISKPFVDESTEKQIKQMMRRLQ